MVLVCRTLLLFGLFGIVCCPAEENFGRRTPDGLGGAKRTTVSGCSLSASNGVHLVDRASILFSKWRIQRTGMDLHIGPLLGWFLELGVLPRGQKNRSENREECGLGHSS